MQAVLFLKQTPIRIIKNDSMFDHVEIDIFNTGRSLHT